MSPDVRNLQVDSNCRISILPTERTCAMPQQVFEYNHSSMWQAAGGRKTGAHRLKGHHCWVGAELRSIPRPMLFDGSSSALVTTPQWPGQCTTVVLIETSKSSSSR